MGCLIARSYLRAAVDESAGAVRVPASRSGLTGGAQTGPRLASGWCLPGGPFLVTALSRPGGRGPRRSRAARPPALQAPAFGPGLGRHPFRFPGLTGRTSAGRLICAGIEADPNVLAQRQVSSLGSLRGDRPPSCGWWRRQRHLVDLALAACAADRLARRRGRWVACAADVERVVVYLVEGLFPGHAAIAPGPRSRRLGDGLVPAVSLMRVAGTRPAMRLR